MRILVVEDHSDTAEMMGRLLRAWGFDVRCAANGADALRRCAEWPFDLLIADIGLPDCDGWTLLRLMREAGGLAKSIALSGYGAFADVERSRAAGFDVHLTKPVERQLLKRTVANLLRFPAERAPPDMAPAVT